MAYILLALGAVMSLVGLVAMITGYPSIEMERGWATVISGAVLLSGGLIVVALGLVVRNLVGLRNALPVVGVLPGSAEAHAPEPFIPAPLMPAVSSAPPPFGTPTTTGPAAAFDPHPTLGLAVPAGVAALAAAGALRDERDPPHFSDTPTAPETPAHETPAHETPAGTHDAEPHPEEAHAFELHKSAALVPEAYIPEAHPPQPAREHEPPHDKLVESEHGNSDGDWLDQAFSAFDHEMTNGRANTPSATAPEPHPEPAHAREPMTEPAHDAEPDAPNTVAASDVEHHAPDPHAAEAPATAPAEPAADLAVIGRYDSEGTSYVMYSDGSIEAQSEAGVYRFGSMAELKAFIEN